MTCLIFTIIGSGIFGGTINFFQLYSDENKGWINYWKCIVAGIGASFLVPLFLQMISSNLVENAKTSDKDLLVFIGFCLIASIYSRRFIETIGEKVLRQVQEAKETAETAKEIAQNNKEEVELLTSKSTEFDEQEQVVPESVTTTTTTAKTDISNVTTETKDDIIRILKALKDNLYTFRTLKGITKDAAVTEKRATAILNALIRREWVKEINKNGKVLYALTESGNKIKINMED